MTRYNLINVLILLAFLMIGATATPRAQQYIGSYYQPNVVVNDSLIESLAPRPNIAKSLLRIRGMDSETNTTGYALPSISSKNTSNKPSSNSKRVVLIPPGPTRPPRYKSKKLKITKTKSPTIQQPKKGVVKPKISRRSKPQRKSPIFLSDMMPPKPPKTINPIRKVIINTAGTKKDGAPVSSAIFPPPPVFTNRQKSLAAASTKTFKSPEKKSKTVVSALPSKQKIFKASSKFTIKFIAESSSFDSRAIAQLSNILKMLRENKSYSVQLSSYSNSRDGSAIQARRISLSRALITRSHFIENGITRTRIGVKALGNNFGNEYPNRIDIVVRKR